jgi:hypothetical protein
MRKRVMRREPLCGAMVGEDTSSTKEEPMNPTGPAITSIESRPRVALLVGRFQWFIIAAVLTAVVSTSFLLGVAPAAQADPTDIGYRDFNYGSGTANPTSEKPQSKLWFNDGT